MSLVVFPENQFSELVFKRFAIPHPQMLTIPPYSTFSGNRDSFFAYKRPINGKRSKRTVSEASKYHQPKDAENPQPYWIYSEFDIDWLPSKGLLIYSFPRKTPFSYMDCQSIAYPCSNKILFPFLMPTYSIQIIVNSIAVFFNWNAR